MNADSQELQLLTSTEDWVIAHFYICRYIKSLRRICFWNRKRKIWDFNCSLDCRYKYCLTAMEDLQEIDIDAYVADYKLDEVVLGQDIYRREIGQLELIV